MGIGLALLQQVGIAGAVSVDDGSTIDNLQGIIQTYAAEQAVYGAPEAQGQTLSIFEHEALHLIIGETYGGNGKTNFALPNLSGRAVLGGAPGTVGGSTLAMTWMIALDDPVAGMVVPYAGARAPSGWMSCKGQLLQITDYAPLYSAIGTTFGGDGTTSFAIPDLAGATAVGTGGGVALGQRVSADGYDGVGLTYMINAGIVAPSYLGQGQFPVDPSVASHVVASASATIPEGWLLCDGTELPIQGEYHTLYEQIFTSFGGSGNSHFALPDLRARAVLGR